jgi:mannose/fructose/N-acetylgalactosamine-specific phosphotransferase system component IIC
MLGFLLFIVIFVLVIGLVIISTIFGFIRSIFSFGKRNIQAQSAQSQNYGHTSSKNKIFESNEGEYVDYEEIK